MMRRAGRLTEFLKWMAVNDGEAFEPAIVHAGFDPELNSSMCNQFVNCGPHPTKKDRSGHPMPYFFLTDQGRRHAQGTSTKQGHKK